MNAPTMKRCTQRRCKHMFPIADERKTCPMCRARAQRHKGTTKHKASNKRYRDGEKGKAASKRYKTGEAGKAARRKYRDGEKNKAAQKRYQQSPKGKVHLKRRMAKRMNQLNRSLRLMILGVHPNPQSFRSLGIFDDNADAEAFFESTKTEKWMKTAPWGKRTSTTLPQTVLQIGHRIPKVWYRHDDLAEVKKAWSRANLFAQCAVENTDANHRNILTREQWLSLKAIWPKQCARMTDEEAWIWARDNADNATRRANRKAVAGPSNLNATFETESDDSD